MTADSLARDYGVLIGAIAGLIIAVSVAVVVWRRQWRTISASFGDMKVTLDQASGQIEQINKAVNNVPDGEHTLVQRVAALEAGQLWEHSALHVIAGQIGVSLPQTPPRARWFQ